ncbi:MAG: hypothetical protein ACJ8AT_21470, partial [Hyalangium sp.]
MSSLKIETPRVSLPVRTPAQQSAPATASPGIVPPARTAPKADGFEKKRLPVAGSGGSVFGTSSTGAKAS